MANTPSARERLLVAATKVVSDVGAGHLTLDRVAEAAGVSKGGLLYHFASKRELIQAMTAEVLAEFQTKIEDKIEETDGTDNVRLVAVIKVMQERSASEKLRLRALLAASAENPELLEPAKVVLKNHFDEIEDEATDADLALTILLAVEGIRFMELFELLPLKHKEVNRMLEKLLEMCTSSR